jgi:hypothetical protein
MSLSDFETRWRKFIEFSGDDIEVLTDTFGVKSWRAKGTDGPIYGVNHCEFQYWRGTDQRDNLPDWLNEESKDTPYRKGD